MPHSYIPIMFNFTLHVFHMVNIDVPASVDTQLECVQVMQWRSQSCSGTGTATYTVMHNVRKVSVWEHALLWESAWPPQENFGI